jgi:hypothetical protein
MSLPALWHDLVSCDVCWFYKTQDECQDTFLIVPIWQLQKHLRQVIGTSQYRILNSCVMVDIGKEGEMTTEMDKILLDESREREYVMWQERVSHMEMWNDRLQWQL